MARTLPWQVGQPQPAKKSRKTPAPRPNPDGLAHTIDSDQIKDGTSTGDRGRAPTTNPTANSDRRSPSSSPVRGPPPAESMHEGYDRDDIYIMVEDEFQTVAQSYTAHLHYAEYKRLVKQAREAVPKPLPEPTSPMTVETKNRLRTAALRKKQTQTLRQITGVKDQEEQEEDEGADLWSGTTLAPLMAGGSQHKQSLVGLERISSNTKAGRGVMRNRNYHRESKEDEDDDLEKDADQSKATIQEAGVAGFSASPDSLVPNSTSRAAVSSGSKRKISEVHTKPTESSKAKRKFVFDLDDGFDLPSSGTSSRNGAGGSQRIPGSKGNSSIKQEPQTQKKEKEKSRLDEVPMFMF